jgi:hypothetical protein
MYTPSLCSYGRSGPDRNSSFASKLGAIATAAIVATLVAVLAPGFVPAVSARTSTTVNLSVTAPPGSREALDPPLTDKATIGHRRADDGVKRVEECAQNWPYNVPDCLRDERQPDGRARTVRLITLDHMPPTNETNVRSTIGPRSTGGESQSRTAVS